MILLVEAEVEEAFSCSWCSGTAQSCPENPSLQVHSPSKQRPCPLQLLTQLRRIMKAGLLVASRGAAGSAAEAGAGAGAFITTSRLPSLDGGSLSWTRETSVDDRSGPPPLWLEKYPCIGPPSPEGAVPSLTVQSSPL